MSMVRVLMAVVALLGLPAGLGRAPGSRGPPREPEMGGRRLVGLSAVAKAEFGNRDLLPPLISWTCRMSRYSRMTVMDHKVLTETKGVL
jgi:hypothetical protein